MERSRDGRWSDPAGSCAVEELCCTPRSCAHLGRLARHSRGVAGVQPVDQCGVMVHSLLRAQLAVRPGSQDVVGSTPHGSQDRRGVASFASTATGRDDCYNWLISDLRTIWSSRRTTLSFGLLHLLIARAAWFEALTCAQWKALQAECLAKPVRHRL